MVCGAESSEALRKRAEQTQAMKQSIRTLEDTIETLKRELTSHSSAPAEDRLIDMVEQTQLEVEKVVPASDGAVDQARRSLDCSAEGRRQFWGGSYQTTIHRTEKQDR
jgi:gas vesicle protein